MGTCVSYRNQQQNESNTIDQIRLNELSQNSNLEFELSGQNYEDVGISNMEESIQMRQLDVGEFQKQQPLENQKIHHQLVSSLQYYQQLNLNDSENGSSNLQVDLELRSLNIKVLDKMQSRNSSLIEPEKRSERSYTQGLQYKAKNNNLIQQSETNKHLIDFMTKGEKDALLHPLPSPPNLNRNNELGVYEAFDSAELTPQTPSKQESECEELEVEPPEQEEEIAEIQKEEDKTPEHQSMNSDKSKQQTVLDNQLFEQHQEDTISLEDDNPEEVQQPNPPPQERQIILQSSKGEQMIMSFAPNVQQLLIKSQQYSIFENQGENAIEVINHKPRLERAVPSDTDILKIENEHVIALSAQLEPININVDMNNCEMLGPYIILNTGDIYVGTWQMGKRHGFGKQIFSNGAYYEGQWLNDFLQGYGRYIFQNGDYYSGEFVCGEREGVGVLVYQDGSSYEGKWVKNQKEGEGREQLADGNVYIGAFKANKKEGKGRLEYIDGCVFEGMFKEGYVCGKGTQTWADGKRYEGEWKDGKMHGQGEFQWGEAKFYKGEYVNNVRQGYGEYSWPDGRTYKGGWKNGVMHGKGLMIWPDQRLQKGIWINGQRQFTKEEQAVLQKAKKLNTADTTINKTKDFGVEQKEQQPKQSEPKKRTKSKSKERKIKTESKN